MIRSLVRYTQVISVIGDILTIRAKGASFGELALVENRNGEESFAQVIRLRGGEVSLQVFSGGRGVSTGARGRFLGHPMQVPVSEYVLGRVFRGSGAPTLGAVKTFLGLSYDRVYKRFYPAIDPLISWSRYLEQLRPHFNEHVSAGWADAVARMQAMMEKGDEVYRMMPVTGEEGVTPEDYTLYQKATFVDMVYLQQDAFDPVDVSMSLDRQRETFALVQRFTDREYGFQDKEQARDYFTRLTNLFKNLNYSEHCEEQYGSFLAQIEKTSNEYR